MISSHPIASTIVLILGLQALIFSVLLLVKRPRRTSNFLLALVLFFFALMEVNLGVGTLLSTFDLFQVFRYVQLELLFGIGPSLYLFTKSVTDPSYRISRKEYLHFVPVILEFIFYRTNLYRLGANGLYQDPAHPFTPIYLAEQWLGIASILFYIILSLRLLVKYQSWVKGLYSNLQNKSLGWLRIPVFIYSFFWIFWIGLTKVDYFFFQNAFRDFYFFPINIGLSFITLWIGFKGYVKAQTEAAGFLQPSTNKDTGYSSPPNPKEAEKITYLMNTQKPYVDPDLDLPKLAKLVGMNPKVISRIINHDLKMNFYEFVNKYRVKEFQHRLQQAAHDQYTLLGHAYECGFNSKSTFNFIFKKYTGQTPSEYYKKVKK